MSQQELKDRITRARARLEELESTLIGCSTCEHFDPRTRGCAAFAELVPPDYDGADCPRYAFLDIPF